ncbi:hypothetical protein PBY51_001321 [Eleginops maclovinus]|uniref:Uncharacterized protein n=1 Tax=Eleginops maclovinus TaxID=56733 RepID=A0AAN7WXM1_ELEMC|nr:hypothetical protein PBY51_001321 [Eleginops maclovinus]
MQAPSVSTHWACSIPSIYGRPGKVRIKGGGGDRMGAKHQRSAVLALQKKRPIMETFLNTQLDQLHAGVEGEPPRSGAAEPDEVTAGLQRKNNPRGSIGKEKRGEGSTAE